MNYLSTKKYTIGRQILCYEHTLECKKLKKPLTIAHISDLHLKKTEKKRRQLLVYLQHLIIRDYDFAVITGDLLDEDVSELEEYENELRLLVKHKPIYFVDGNHEDKTGQSTLIKKILENIGIVILENSTKQISDRIVLHGISNTKPKPYHIQPGLNIVVCHHFDNITTFDADLILCGHFHAREINLGLIDGVTYLKHIKHTKNIHNHTTRFRHFENSLVFIHPGMHTSNPIKQRIFTDKEGLVMLKIIP